MQKDLVEVVVLAKTGDKESFQSLFLNYKDSSIRYLLSLGMTLDEAEDVYTETFIYAVFLRLGQLQDPHFFRGWFKRALRRRQISHALKEKSWRQRCLLPVFVPHLFNPAERLETAERNLQLQNFLNSLSDLDRQTLRAFYWDELSISQMSERFNAPEGTIKRRLHVARKRFKEQAEKQGFVPC